MPPSPTSDHFQPVPDQQLRRRRLRGYLDSDDDDDLLDDDSYQEKPSRLPIPLFDDEDDCSFNDSSTLVASLLPLHLRTEKVPIPDLTRSQRFLASFTLYREMRDAQFESHFDAVFGRLKIEWQWTCMIVSPSIYACVGC